MKTVTIWTGKTARLADGLILAFQTLTVLPTPQVRDPRIETSLYWFPLVGAIVGLGGYAIGQFLVAVVSSSVTGFLIIVYFAAITGGIHLDGLADACDGLLGVRERDRALQIMKDSAIGAYGAVALILVLIGKWMAIERLVEQNLVHWLVLICLSSRMSLVLMTIRFPYARSGTGTAWPYVSEASSKHLITPLLLTVAPVAMIFKLHGILILMAALAIAWGLGYWCYKRIHGITGDVLGGANEIIELSLLLVLAAR